MRARARELFSSPGMASIRLAVDKEIAAKKLVVREDKDMYAGKSRTGTQRRETDPHRSGLCVSFFSSGSRP